MKPITTDDVFDLLDYYVTSAALGAAMELGLFWLLAEQPMDAATLAQQLGIPGNRCQYWLQLLSSAGLVEQTAKGHAPSATARSAILESYSQETWAFLAQEARDRYPAVGNLAAHMRLPESTWALQGLVPPDYFAALVDSPDMARRFTRMLYEIHLPWADTLAQSLNMRGVERMMDLGGGSGVMSFALLRRYPNLTSVVVDIPNVCAAGRELARENGLEERISYYPADFGRDDLPSGFDRVLECDVGGFSEALLQKIRSALNPGGRLVIVNPFAPAPGVAPRSYLYWAFPISMADPGFTLLTTGQVRERLAAASFRPISEKVLPPQEVRRWSSDWTVIEAVDENSAALTLG